jgi:hypothetical protein
MLTIDLHTQGHNLTLNLDKEQRTLIAQEGWAYFVDFDVPMYRKPPSSL